MVHTIASFKECTASDGDWLDALIVGADYMKAATEYVLVCRTLI